MIEFEGRPFSPKANKTAAGLSITIDMDDSQFEAWSKFAEARGKNFLFRAELSPHQPDHPTDP